MPGNPSLRRALRALAAREESGKGRFVFLILVKFVLSEFYNETQEPYRLAEFLIDEGLKIIVERLKANPEMTLLELVGS